MVKRDMQLFESSYHLTITDQYLNLVNPVGAQFYEPRSDIIVGNDVLFLDPETNYNIHFPMRRGDLNIHNKIGGSLTSVLADLQCIWSTVIQDKLNIPLNTLKHYRAVLIVPNIYNRQQLRELSSLIFELGFYSFYLLQDQVAATFRAGVQSACVIDCGHSKTSISCIEEGISHPMTRIPLPYGGGDISQSLFWLLTKCGFPYRECNPSNSYDSLLLEKIKQETCHVDLNVCGCREKTFIVNKPKHPGLKYTIQTAEECIIAPLGLFQPELFSFTVNWSMIIQKLTFGDSFDPYDAEFSGETSRKGTKKLQESSSDSNDDGDILETDQLQFLALDEAVIQTIQRCASIAIICKMFSCIIIVGGGMKFNGIANWLKSKLECQILKPKVMEIISSPKEMDSIMTVWCVNINSFKISPEIVDNERRIS